MALDVHSALPAVAHGAAGAADDQINLDLDREGTWAETLITIAGTGVTVLFVSFVAVLMALA